MIKRIVAIGVVALAVAACQDDAVTDPRATIYERPNIAITDADDSYGFVDGFFSFLKPLVDDPVINGNTLNQNLKPTIELWLRSDLIIEVEGEEHACSPKVTGDEPEAKFIPQVNIEGTAYTYGWKTSDEPAGGVIEGTDYRLCVKVKLASGDQLVGWRDVRPEKSIDPNHPAGLPYLFTAGRNIPIEFWLSSRALCTDVDGKVIDCTVATFDGAGGTAVCDSAQCGLEVPEGAVNGLITFTVQYVKCDSTAGRVDHLDIDIPQHPGCLKVSAVSSVPWTGIFEELGDASSEGIVAAACRADDYLLDERFLLHIDGNDGNVYALPTRPFPELNCGPEGFVRAPGSDGSFGDWMRFYAARGTGALKHALVPWIDPPELKAGHVGMGGGTSLSCSGFRASGAGDDPQTITSCTAPVLVAGDGPLWSSALTTIDAGVPVDFDLVWAIPSKMTEREEVLTLGPPITSREWIDPLAVAIGDPLYPGVLVTDDCKVDSDGTVTEDCDGFNESPVANAVVTFVDEGGTAIGTGVTGTDGIARPDNPWVLTTSGVHSAYASGRGIGIHDTLAAHAYVGAPPSVTADPDAAEGSYQDHIGNNAVQLLEPKLRFQASVCTDYRAVLDTNGVEAVYTTAGRVDTIPINISGAGDEAYLYTLSDCYNTYFALKLQAAEELQNSLRIVFVDEQTYGDTLPPVQFDAEPKANVLVDGILRSDDMWMIRRGDDKKDPSTYGKWLIEDWRVSDDCTGSSKQSECGAIDAGGLPFQNLNGNTNGVVFEDGATGETVFEFARCFDCEYDPQDFPTPAVGQSMRIGFYLVLQMGKGAQGNTEWPDFRVFQPITITRQ
jgi:hypothetical protein